jgi:serpin B
MYRAEVDILLPLFTTESDTKLNDVLSKMGMPNAFAPNANFSKISNVPLYVSEMKQKAKIEVNEEGTKASAVTVAEMALGSAIGGQLTRPKKVDFHADRPFIYLIREMSTGTIFFMGKYIGV